MSNLVTFDTLQFNRNGYYIGQPVISVANPPSTAARLGIPHQQMKGTIRYIDNGDTRIRWILPDGDEGAHTETWVSSLAYEYFHPIVEEMNSVSDTEATCAYCGAIVPKDELTYVTGLGWVDKDCLEQHFFKCPDCGRWESNVHKNDVRGRDDEIIKSVCRACITSERRYALCENCNTWYSRTDAFLIRTGSGGWVCEGCSEDYQRCPECGDYWPEGGFEYVRTCDDAVCESCAPRLRQRAIRSYGYKPIPKFKVKHKSDQFETDASIHELLFGVELEIDRGRNANDCALELLDASSDIYCKHDGSLGDSGIEIVTHPATLYYHEHELGWDKIIEVARRFGYTSHEARTCGLHVHIGRRQLEEGSTSTQCNAAKLVLCMNRHWDNFVKFSRRTESQLDDWAKKNDVAFEEALDEGSLMDEALATEDEGRYQAVNLTNENTVEIRIFRGTLVLNTLLATLQIVSNMCKYCMKHTALEVMNSQWEDIAYFEDHAELADYLIERELAQTSLLDRLPAFELASSNPSHYVEPENVTGLRDDGRPILEGISLPMRTRCRIGEFEVGEYVLVTANGPGQEYAPIGHVGRVINRSGANLGIRFSFTRPYLHQLHGAIDDDSGYYINPCKLLHYNCNLHPDIALPGEDEPMTFADSTADPAIGLWF